MAQQKVAAAADPRQVTDQPQVSIVYQPEKALIILNQDAQGALGKLQGITGVASLKSLEITTELIHDGETGLARLTEFRDSLAHRVKAAFAPFLEMPGFEGAGINITLTWPLRQKLDTAITRARTARAQYLAAEQEKTRQAQLAAEAKQREENQKRADAAAKAAKKSGADRETIAEIKSDVMSKPAPLVSSRAIDTAKGAGVSLVYRYVAKCTDLRAFLTACLANPVLFNTLLAAEPDIEGAFNKLASDQKEHFSYPGMTYEKIASDRQRGR